MPAPTPNTSSQITLFEFSFESDSPLSALNTLLLGSKWGGPVGEAATLYYSFPTSKNTALWSQDPDFGYARSDAEYQTLTPLSGSQQAGVRMALQAWANVANIEFIATSESQNTVGDLRFGFTSSSLMTANTYAYAYVLDKDDTETHYAMAGDIWFNKTQPVAAGNNFSKGAMGYLVSLHEIGHALGLDHSFAETGDPSSLPDNIEYLQYTVMSYSDTKTTLNDGLNDFYPTTPMLYDILAIQYLYGANMTYNSGNTVYDFNGTQRYYQTIWDAGGIDTIRYTSSTGGVINLNAGQFSQLGKPIAVGKNNSVTQKETVAIAFDVVIENAIGGNGHDEIIGNEVGNKLEGGAGNDVLRGNDGNDTLLGGTGADRLLAGIGDDRMEGGAGDDEYQVESEGDQVIELGNAGIDHVRASISYTLTNHVENLILIGIDKLDGTGNSLNNQLTGNDGSNTLNGLTGNDTLQGLAGEDSLNGDAGDDVLDGGSEADSIQGGLGKDKLYGRSGGDVLDGGEDIDQLEGGIGNDTYIVDITVAGKLQDTVVEIFENDSLDTIILRGASSNTIASVLQLASNIEVLDASATESSLLHFQGNNLNNILIGNVADNLINGLTGDDTMQGLAGNDIYVVDSEGDRIDEAEDEGIDTVWITIDQADGQYVLTENIENAVIQNQKTFDLIGNDLNNVLTGNLLHNTLTGGLGDDTYVVDLKVSGSGQLAEAFIEDTIIEAAGLDEGSDTLSLRGTVTLVNATTFDLSQSYKGIEHIDASGTGNSKLHLVGDDDDNQLTGNAAANRLEGGLGNDTLNGLAGADTLTGGAGDDTYVVDVVGDVVIELEAEGVDTVKTGLGYTLGEHIENLTLTGSGNINGTGNEADNFLIGNDGNNVLNGGLGADTLTGGKGNDTFIVDNEGDSVFENDNEGVDTVKSAVSFILGDFIEHLTLTGTEAIDATGNALKNTLTGNSADNILDGGEGIDHLIGGQGNDVYRIALTAFGSTASTMQVKLEDTLAESANAGEDTLELYGAFDHLQASTLVLAANVEHLDASATGETKLHLTGNGLQNTLTGNDAANRLDGAAGVDTLTGGLGDDTYVVDLKVSGSGQLAEAFIEDTIIEAAGLDEGSDTLSLRGTVTLVNATTFDLSQTYEGIEHIDASGTGNSKLHLVGDDDDNQLTGNAAANRLEGGLGNDTLNGLAGADTLTGGAGDDTYVVDVAGDVVIELEAEGVDTVKTGLGYTLGEHIENLTLTGSGNINGTGNEADNFLIGNDGNNVLNGGLGADTLTGGKGNDTFVISAADSLLQFDTITDFKQMGADKLMLSKSLFTGLLSATPTAKGVALNASDFVAGSLIDETTNETEGSHYHLLFNTSTGLLYYDADGDGSGQGITIALLGSSQVPALVSTDILVTV